MILAIPSTFILQISFIPKTSRLGPAAFYFLTPELPKQYSRRQRQAPRSFTDYYSVFKINKLLKIKGSRNAQYGQYAVSEYATSTWVSVII
jgi:hypothetical protein